MLVTRLASALGWGFVGLVAGGMLGSFVVWLTFGVGDTGARIGTLCSVLGAAVGIAFAELRSAGGDGRGASTRAFGRVAIGTVILRAVLLVGAAALEVLFLLDPLGTWVWLPTVGLVAVCLALLVVTRPAARPVSATLGLVTLVPTMVLLPAFGLGLLLAPAAVSLLLSAALPNRWGEGGSDFGARSRTLAE